MSEGASPQPAGGRVACSISGEPSEGGSEPPAAAASVSSKLFALEKAFSVATPPPTKSTRYGEVVLLPFWGTYRALCPASGGRRFPLGRALAVEDLTCGRCQGIMLIACFCSGRVGTCGGLFEKKNAGAMM